jgi:hypothetical protein
MQRRQLTTRSFESSFENAFRATLTILQDQGYIIKNTDMDSGLIVANVDRKTATGLQLLQHLFVGFAWDKGTEVEVSCVVNKINERTNETRINIQEVKYGESSWFSGTSKQSSKQIYEPSLYQRLFNEITIEIKRREAYESVSAIQSPKALQTNQRTGQPSNQRDGHVNKIRIIYENADVRVFPDLKSELLTRLKLGQVLGVLEKVGEWFKIRTLSADSDFVLEGYIHQSYAQELSDNEADEKTANKVAVIILKDRTVIKGKVIKQDKERVTVETSLGIITLERTRILKIE